VAGATKREFVGTAIARRDAGSLYSGSVTNF
jgi:hypothetical protein